MSNAVATVSFLQGQAWAKAPDGTLRALTLGSRLNEDEILVTAQGARVELDVGTGDALVVNGGEEVGMSRDFLAETATEADEALLSDASVQEALTVLEQGGDLLEELEEPAAGNSGGGSSEGHDFVQLTRIIETTDPLAFEYSSVPQAVQVSVENDAEYINRAPLAVDQTLTVNEDEILSGQIIATDLEGDAITFTLSSPPTNGSLVVNPATGQFTYTPNANYTGSDSFVVSISDGNGGTTTSRITIGVTPANDGPVTADQNLTTPEDVALAGQVVATDIDGDTLAYTVSGQPLNGTVSLNPATGQFTYTPNANYTGSDSFVVSISDGNGGTAASRITIGVTPVNDGPVTADQNLTTPEDVALAGQVVATDVDGDTLSYTVSGQPLNGTVSLNSATGQFTYTPNANYTGSDSFVVSISDGNGGTTTSRITIGVTPANDGPVTADQNLTTPEDVALAGQVVATDIDGDTLSYTVSGQPVNGTVSLNPATGQFTYTPNANYTGSDSFVVSISDGNGGTITSRITIGVTPVNDGPVTADQNLTTPEDVVLAGQVVATDIDGDTLSYTVSGQPLNGTVSLNPATGQFTYTPNANYTGSDSFVVSISDGNGGTTTSRITIGVTPVNDGPVTADQNLTTPEDVALAGQVVATDIDGDTLAYTVSGQPLNGSVSLNSATGQFTYTPNANYTGSDSFVVSISDGNGGTTTSRITIGVTPVNDGPVTSDQNLTTPEDVVLAGQVVAMDIDGDTLAYTVSGQPVHGTVSLNPATGQFTYTPNANYTGSDSFVVSISDGNGGTTTSRITIGVTPANDGPVTADQNLTTPEDVVLAGQVVATDVDGDTLAYTLSGQPVNGTVSLNPATGQFTYTPNANYTGSDSFVVSISDGNGGTTTSRITIGVTPANDGPVTSDQNLTTPEDVVLAGQVVATDVDGDTLSYTVSGQPLNGSVSLNPATGQFTYTPNANHTGSDSFVVSISDGNGGTTTSRITIGVTPANDGPVTADQNLTTPEDVVLAGQVVATDVDGDTLAYTVSGQPVNGSVSLNSATGQFTYTPNANYTGSDSFVVSISDGNGGTAASRITIGVTPVNDGPVTADQNLTTPEDVALAGQVVATDVDGDTLSYTVSGQPLNGTVSLNSATGQFTYTPNANYTGSDSFVVSISDGNGGTTTSRITIGVTPANDGPVTSDQNLTTPEDVALAGQVVATDIDGDTLAYTVSGQPVNGTVSLNPTTGQFTYTPNANYTGSDSFVVSISDGNGGTATSRITIGVTPVNDGPVTADQNLTTPEDVVLAGQVVAMDIDGDTLSYTVSGQPLNGSVSLNSATGQFTYTPNANYTGSDSFVVSISDGNGGTTTSRITIGVTPVNDGPVTADQNLTTPEDVVLAGQVVATDIDGDTLAYTVSGQPVNGTVSLNSATGQFTYTPNANYTGSDSFVVSISDGNGGTTTSRITIGVTPVNDGPVTADQNLTTPEDVVLAGQVVATDIDGDTLAYTVSGQPVNGTVSLNPTTGQFTYTPNANYTGSDSFVVSISDGNGGTATSRITIGVTPVNDGPVTADQNLTTPEDVVLAGQVVATDIDGDTLSYTVSGQPLNGSVSLNSATGQFTYTPNANYTGSDSFVVSISDGNGGTTTSRITIGVTPANDAPLAIADSATVDQDQVLTLNAAQLLANDTDADLDTLTIDSVQGAVNGSVSLVGGNVVFTPTAGYHGPASFTYTITDGKGGSSTASVDITVAKLNSAPDAVGDSAVPSAVTSVGFFSEYFGYNEGVNGANLTNIQQVYSFINGRSADATFTAKSFDYGAAFTSGTNLGNANNLQTFLGSDAASLSTDPATSTDAIIRMRGFVELNAGTYNFKVQGDDGYQILVDGIVVAEVNQNQSLTTRIHNPFTLSASGLHHVEIIYWDQGNHARLKVELSDDAGFTYDLLSAVPNYSTAVFSAVEDTPLNIAAASLLANDTDVDGDTLTITGVSGAVNGTVSLVAGNIIFTPAANYSGPASFTYTISDGKGGSDTATVNLSVSAVNDAPTALADTGKTALNTALTIPVSTLLANDSDVEANPISIVSVQGATNGTVSLSGSNVLFTPATNFEGVASFTYTIRDTAGATSTVAVNVSVGAASAPSLVVSKSLLAIAQGTGGTSVKFPVITSLVDTDGSESLSIRISGVPASLSFNAGTNLGGGVWQFVPADLPNLTLNLPGSYTTLATNLTVQVTSTEVHGGATASVSSVVTLKAAFTSVDFTTTESGNFTGSSANEHIQGGSGNNTINGSSGNNIIHGGAGDDNLSALAGSDIFFGGSGNDTINGGSGTDRISGGAGNDLLRGGDAGENFVDVFVWSLGDQGAAGAPAVDTIQNFATAAAGNSTNGGDVLDLRDLLQGEQVGPNNASGNLADYLHFEVSGGDTIIHISHTGGFSGDSHAVGAGFTGSAETQKIVLSGVNLQSLYSGATTDQQIITQLLNNNKLITD